MNNYEQWIEEVELLTGVEGIKLDPEETYDCLETDERIRYSLMMLRSEFTKMERRVKKSTEDLKSSYENLLRINKERSNKDRNLDDAKKHSGFIILDSCQFVYHFNKDNYYVYRTLIQTPYSAKLSYDEYDAQLTMNGEFGNMIKEIGWTYHIDWTVEKAYEESDRKKLNIVFDCLYDRRLKEGYWTVTLYHIRALQTIHDKYLPKFRNGHEK